MLSGLNRVSWLFVLTGVVSYLVLILVMNKDQGEDLVDRDGTEVKFGILASFYLTVSAILLAHSLPSGCHDV